MVPPAAGGRAAALLRGSLVHRLMQSLPDIPTERQRKAAQDYLARAGVKLAAGEREQLAEQVMLVLEHPHFYELFAPGSRAEVPVVADFKTNRPAPRRIEDVPPSYVRQLALYRAVLAKLYPDKPVHAALIWTEVPDLMELSGEALDAALARITSAR